MVIMYLVVYSIYCVSYELSSSMTLVVDVGCGWGVLHIFFLCFSYHYQCFERLFESIVLCGVYPKTYLPRHHTNPSEGDHTPKILGIHDHLYGAHPRACD